MVDWVKGEWISLADKKTPRLGVFPQLMVHALFYLVGRICEVQIVPCPPGHKGREPCPDSLDYVEIT